MLFRIIKYLERKVKLEARGWQSFSVKVQIVSISGFAGDMVSVITTQL